MLRLYRSCSAVILVAFGAVTAQAAEKSQATCTSGDLVRRVIVEVGDLNSGLPCEVVYWKDKEAPGVRRVLWTAQSSSAFCDNKAAGLVDKLASAGWNCSGGGETGTSAAAPANAAQSVAAATPTQSAPAPTAPAQSGQAVTAPAPTGSTTVPAVDAATTAGAAPAPATQQPSATAALQPSTTAPDSSGSAQNVQTAAVSPGGPTDPAQFSQLQTVIDANLSSLNQSVDGDFQAQIGDFGDLNSDGIDDAVVFFNYESSTADFTQFVAAYLYNGESYHLAATKPVGGTDLAVRQVEVETIVDGSIQLRLVLNDAAQTENRRAAMILKDGQLVEIQ